jgi:hypothetical protein
MSICLNIGVIPAHGLVQDKKLIACGFVVLEFKQSLRVGIPKPELHCH